MSRNKGGDLQNIFKYHSGLKTILESPIWDLDPTVVTSPPPWKFQFSSITPFLGPKSSNPYCRKGSYGPYGPFWFSAKNRRDLVQRYQNGIFWEKYIFHFIRKINLFHGGNFLKRSLVRGPLEAYIFIFWKYWKQPILTISHPGSHSIKPVNWTAILAVTQSNQ